MWTQRTIIFILLFTSCISEESDKVDTDNLRVSFLASENELWQLIYNMKNTNNSRNEITLLNKFHTICDELDKKSSRNFLNDPELPILEDVSQYIDLYTEFRLIHALYETFRRFQLSQSQQKFIAPQETWSDLANSILYDTISNVNESLERINFIVINRQLFPTIEREINENFCKDQQSPQQILYYLYNFTAIAQLKAYLMIQFAHMLKYLYGDYDAEIESGVHKSQYQVYTKNLIKSSKTLIENSSRDLWRCDPKVHISGVTYVQMTNLIQGYVENEVNLNIDGSCWKNCAAYSNAKSFGCDKKLTPCKQRRCHGKVLDCRFIASKIRVCPADSNEQSKRRYKYLEYDSGRIMGQKCECGKDEYQLHSWWRWLFWHCSYCFCLCEEQGPNSDVFIDLQLVMANIQNNMVVTGLRFVKKNRIIHLQIQEGKLLPQGNIEEDSTRWVPVSDYFITDKNIHRGQHYVALTWQKRTIDLDDVQADENHVVTGVRFKASGPSVSLSVLTTKFNFKTGQLISEDTIYKQAPWNLIRTEIKLINPDIPIRSKQQSTPSWQPNQNIKITHSDIDKDAAQSTVPFFDSQSVDSRLPKPLSGVGIYHKGAKGSGGFIAPKIITYDISKHLSNN